MYESEANHGVEREQQLPQEATEAPSAGTQSPALGEYVIITPARDEEAYIEQTLDSVCSQTLKPRLWVIVDDNSKDRTAEIVEPYARQHDWIRLIHYDKSAQRTPGAGVVLAFYEGYRLIQSLGIRYDFIVKLDADLSFGSTYFSGVLRKFAEDPKLGIGGGLQWEAEGNKFVAQKLAPGHASGPTKVYRRTCFDQIGGLVARKGWDGIDLYKAQSLGWRTATFRELRILHLRAQGKQIGRLKDLCIGSARGAYFTGYHPLYMVARGVKNMFAHKPYVLGGLAEIGAFFLCYLRGEPQIEDESLRRYVRASQMRRLRFWSR